MLYLIDSANVNFVKSRIETYDVVGVTTNPTIISKEEGEYNSLIHKLNNVLNGRELHVQLNSLTYEKMILEAQSLVEEFGKNLNIKIPVSKDGFRAIKYLCNNGYHVTATAICTVNQGIMAALLGAKYIAVYVNRISNSGVDGNMVIRDIKKTVTKLDLDTKIIGASYKSVYQVTESIMNGADQVTVGIDLFDKLFSSDITDQSILQFTKDFSSKK